MADSCHRPFQAFVDYVQFRVSVVRAISCIHMCIYNLRIPAFSYY